MAAPLRPATAQGHHHRVLHGCCRSVAGSGDQHAHVRACSWWVVHVRSRSVDLCRTTSTDVSLTSTPRTVDRRRDCRRSRRDGRDRRDRLPGRGRPSGRGHRRPGVRVVPAGAPVASRAGVVRGRIRGRWGRVGSRGAWSCTGGRWGWSIPARRGGGRPASRRVRQGRPRARCPSFLGSVSRGRPAEPDVPVSRHPALHESFRR
jgi:hypothetical protein